MTPSARGSASHQRIGWSSGAAPLEPGDEVDVEQVAQQLGLDRVVDGGHVLDLQDVSPVARQSNLQPVGGHAVGLAVAVLVDDDEAGGGALAVLLGSRARASK